MASVPTVLADHRIKGGVVVASREDLWLASMVLADHRIKGGVVVASIKQGCSHRQVSGYMAFITKVATVFSFLVQEGCGRFADRRFADKLFDPETFRRHMSDVSPTHFGRFADNPSDVSPTNS